MIAKEIAMPRTGGSFRGLVTYLTSGRGKAERVGRVSLTNCVSSDVPSAVLEVENHHGRNRRAQHTTYHLLLSFREEPAPDVLRAIEERACAALGFADHRRVSVVHHDTDHLHVHVAIDRLHPVTHKGHWPPFSKLVLDRACVQLEQEFGLLADRHRTTTQEPLLQAADRLRERLRAQALDQLLGASSWDEVHQVLARHDAHLAERGNGFVIRSTDGASVRASTVARELGRAALERKLGAFAVVAGNGRQDFVEVPSTKRAHDMEHVAGVESLIGWVQRECLVPLLDAGTWRELHATAARNGLVVRVRGNGLAFVAQSGLGIKASSVSRELSRAALERRLGPFEACEMPMGAKAYSRRPVASLRSERLYREFQAARTGYVARRHEVAVRAQQLRQKDAARLEQTTRRRWAAVRLVAHGRVGWAIWAAYARKAAERDRKLARERVQASRRRSLGEPTSCGWLDWLRERAAQGDNEALALLRKRVTPPSWSNVLGGSPRTSEPHRMPARQATSAGVVVYPVQGGSIRDDGQRLHLRSRQPSDDATEQLLRLAVQRYGGRLEAQGGASFCDALVRVAAHRNVPVTFANEQLEARRLDLARRLEDGTRERGFAKHARPPRGTQKRSGTRHLDRRRGHHQPHARELAERATPGSLADMRSVSELDVVRFQGRPKGVLPRDAPPHVDDRRTDSHHKLRWSHAADRVTEPARSFRGRLKR